MITYSRPKLADFYTLFESKPAETIPFIAAHTYIAHIWEYPPPPGGGGGIAFLDLQGLDANQEFQFHRVSPGDLLLAKESEVSGNENVAFRETRVFFLSLIDNGGYC